MRFQEFWGIASSTAYKPLLKRMQTPSGKFKIKSYVATTYLEFSGHTQVFVCVELWSAEAGRVTTQCLILQREILPRIISSMAHPWYNHGSRLESLTSSFELGQYSIINSHVSSKSRKILSCECAGKPAAPAPTPFSALSFQSLSFACLLLPPPGVQHPGHSLTRQTDLSFSPSVPDMIFLQLRLNEKQNH